MLDDLELDDIAVEDLDDDEFDAIGEDDDDDDFGDAEAAERRRFRPFRRRRPIRRVGSLPFGRGVGRATLSTPRGSASLRLPEKVVTQEAFEKTVKQLRAATNTLAGRVKENRTAISRSSSRHARDTRILSRRIAKLKKASSDQAMMSMMMSLMMSQGATRAIGELHPGSDAPQDSNMALMMLPFMMGGSSSDNTMMMMMMMMVASGGFGR